MALPFLAIAFTIFAMAGLAHAVNIIDGFHGLATGSTIVMLAAFAVVSLGAGDRDMASFCFVAAAVFLGFVLASVAVMISWRNPDVSPWVCLVVLAHPLLETAFSVVRKIREGRSPFQPDGSHLHMLIYLRVVQRLARAGGNERHANPAAGALMWAGAMTGLTAVAIIPHDREWSLLVLALLVLLYVLAYRKAAAPAAPRVETDEARA